MSLAEKILSGDLRAVSRLLRDIDDQRESAVDELKELFPHTGSAYLLGITGAPGSGKSTLTDRIVTRFRAENMRVGVLAIDPTSPYTGGAILGDRIRMARHETDSGVFIRSLATRGNLGGLTRSTADSIKVLDAAGYDLVIVETVGVGQDEVDVVGATDTAIVVVVPGLGDDIQAIKAGILEIADLLVVNKADRDGAGKTVRELEVMLDIGRKTGMCDQEAWQPQIVQTVAVKGEGIDELYEAIDCHRASMREMGGVDQHRRRRALIDLTRLIREKGLDRINSIINFKEREAELIEQIAARKTDPYTVAEQLIKEAFGD